MLTKIYILLFNIRSIYGYNLLSYRNISSTNIDFYGCPDISLDLVDTTKSVMEDLNSYNLFKFSYIDEIEYEHEKNNINTICNSDLNDDSSRFGYCRHYMPFFQETDITVSSKLYGKNLYNVVLHEMIHSVGLDHTLIPGIMNYSVISSGTGYIRDNNRMFLSVDDYNGMKQTYNEVTDIDNENDDINCNKRKIIKLLQKCI